MFKRMLVSAVMIGVSSTALAANSMMLSDSVNDYDTTKSCLYKSELHGEGTIMDGMKCVRKRTGNGEDENGPLVWESSFYKQ